MKNKNCLFQYATKFKVFEDTDLISLEEAEDLWNKYLPNLKSSWNEDESPEMCIWTDCNKNTDYSKVLKDIDFRDCELQGGNFYKITKELIK
jgi:hypothetical protein